MIMAISKKFKKKLNSSQIHENNYNSVNNQYYFVKMPIYIHDVND